MIKLRPVSPKRANPIAQTVHLRRHGETVVVFGRVFDPTFNPIPEGKSVLRSGDMRRKPSWIAKREVKTAEHAVASLLRISQFVPTPRLKHLPVSEIDGVSNLLLRNHTGPNRIFLWLWTLIFPARPIDNDDPVKGQSPTSERMKSAIAVVSFRSKTGQDASTLKSAATACTVGSSGASRGFPGSARCASTFG